MAKLFILSGHFFSPAETDPWTGQRHNYSKDELFQTHWKNLSRGCYGANSASRVLNPDGKIRKIVNNYRKLSFSFSPRLLEELEHQAPNVYRRIVDADKESVQRLGHGNALAQPFHDVILPLAREKDVRLQLEWGIAAFKKHFDRAPEGFWLPQQAVSPLVLDLLIELGARFVLLSPWQAEGVMNFGEGSWTALDAAPAPSNRAFRIDRPEGSIAAFFQHPTLSHGLSQEHYLKDAVQLSSTVATLMKKDNEGHFLSIATQGELFGYDEPFADMCLAALWDRLESDSGIQVVNYGLALEVAPPHELVKLKKGKDEEGCSATCFHGVARWKEDCGCREGGVEGWHQKWRGPLREAQSNLQEILESVVEEVLAQNVITDLEEFRRRAIDLYLHTRRPREWARSFLPAGSEDPEREDVLLELAQGLLWTQALMETPLWHFADPSLVESRWGLLASLRALDLLRKHTAQDLFFQYLQDLQKITLNTGESAAVFFEKDLFKRQRDASFPVALFVLDKILRPRAHHTEQIGPYKLTDLTKTYSQVTDLMFRYNGKADVFDRELDRAHSYEYLLVEDHHEGVSLFLKDRSDFHAPQAFDLTRLPMGEREDILQLMSGDLENTLASGTQSIFPLLRRSLVYSRFLNVKPLAVSKTLIELALTKRILGLPASPEGGLSETELSALEEDLAFASEYGLQLDPERLQNHFSLWVAQALSKNENFIEESVVHYLDVLLGTIQRWSFHPDLTVAQALVYEALSENTQELLAALEKGDSHALGKLRCLIRLGGLLMIDTTDLKNRILETR